MSSGLPVVVTVDCGVAELVNQLGCGVVTASDPIDFRNKVLGAVREEGRLTAMAERASAVTTMVSPAAVARQQVLLYRELSELSP
jgi:glycosyltransferase involved in cell wall biosynthesis